MEDAEKFLRDRQYLLDIVDVCIAATANALNLHLYIFENVNGKINIIRQHCLNGEAHRIIFLKYHHIPNGDNIEDHYDAIVDLPENEILFSTPRNPAGGIFLQDTPRSSVNRSVLIEKEVSPADSGYSESPTTAYGSATPRRPQSSRRPAKCSKRPWIKNSRNYLNHFLFASIAPQSVDRVPWEANGNTIYTIDCTEEFWHDLQIDGRHWSMSPSSRKDLVGVRKIGTCEGSFICENSECPKYTSEFVRNEIDFANSKGGKVCKSCGEFAQRPFCGAVKVTEFDRLDNLLTVWYQDEHNCKPKVNIKKAVNYTRNARRRNYPIEVSLRKTPKNFQIDLIGFFLATGKTQQAQEIAGHLADKSILNALMNGDEDNVLKGIRGGAGLNEVDHFRNIGDLKSAFDELDNNYVYKINCRQINGEPSYVFKTSAEALNIALKMDPDIQVEGKKSSLSEEHAFLDGIHKRVKGYITLALWTYHPGMCKIIRLATMDCERENSECIKLFLDKFNEALSKQSGIPGYKFNPIGLMCDEAGANFNAIEASLGQHFLGRTVGCQWHFRRCAKAQIKHINVHEQETFKELYNSLCHTYTVNEYNTKRDTLAAICEKNGIGNWWAWWSARKYHIIPAFRGFNLPGVSYAESGNATIKSRYIMSLAVATWRDVLLIMVQDNEYYAFVNNTAKVTGKGMNARQRQARSLQIETSFVKEGVNVLRNGDINIEAALAMDLEDPSSFVPQENARHRAPAPHESKSRNPAQKRKRKTVTCRQRKKQVNNKILQDTVQGDVEAQHLETNPPHLVFLNYMIKTCKGCHLPFSELDRKFPHDIVFKYNMFRYRPKGDGTYVKNSYRTPGYFHARDLGCIRRNKELRTTELFDIYMTNAALDNIHPQHEEELRRRNLWEAILANRRRLIVDGI